MEEFNRRAGRINTHAQKRENQDGSVTIMYSITKSSSRIRKKGKSPIVIDGDIITTTQKRAEELLQSLGLQS